MQESLRVWGIWGSEKWVWREGAEEKENGRGSGFKPEKNDSISKPQRSPEREKTRKRREYI